jgi:hypothetical protein
MQSMKKIQHSVRWEGWLANAVDEWGRTHGGKSFSDSANYLLACELDRLGYKREFYEPGIYVPEKQTLDIQEKNSKLP